MTAAARERAQVRVPVLFVCAAAWILIAIAPDAVTDHVHTLEIEPGAGAWPAAAGVGPDERPMAALLFDWLLMLTAMMAPLLIAPIRHIRDRSFAHRRRRAIALFVAGYGAVWLAAALVCRAAWTAAGSALPGPYVAASLAAAAFIWQASPMKQRCLNRLRAHPALAAAAPAADRDVVRFGLAHGLWCVGSCGALMLLPVVVPQAHITMMAAVSIWLAAERLEGSRPERWQIRVPARAARLTIPQLSALWRRFVPPLRVAGG